MTDEEMRALPRGAREARLRLQLHHLRRPPDRRPRGRGVRDRAARRTACSRSRACSGSSGCSSRRTARRRRSSAARAPTPRSMSLSGRTATTKAMGKGSTQFQHLVQTEVPPKVLEEWLDDWAQAPRGRRRRSRSRSGRTAPARSCSSSACSTTATRSRRTSSSQPIQDRHGRSILSVRDQNTFDAALRRKRLMTLRAALPDPPLQGGVGALPHADRRQPAPDRADEELGIFSAVNDEVGQIIVADVNSEGVAALVKRGGRAGEADHQDGLRAAVPARPATAGPARTCAAPRRCARRPGAAPGAGRRWARR